MSSWKSNRSMVVITDQNDTPVGYKRTDGLEIMVPYIITRSAVAVSCPADATEDILATVTMPALSVGLNGWIMVFAVWSCTNSVNNKTMRIRLGGIGGTAHLSMVKTTVTNLRTATSIANRGANNSQVGSSEGVDSASGVTSTFATGAIDLSAASSLVFTGQKASAGETLTLDGFAVEIMAGENP